MPLTAVILAAGKSRRMKSALPKPLHEVCGRPMLGYLLDTAFAAGCERVIVVVGHGKELVIDAFGTDDRLVFVEQKEQLGTGHAVQTAVPELPGDGEVVVLAGDLPLVRAESLEALIAGQREAGADLSLATAEVPDPFGYGRIIRDDAGGFLRIVEQKDATPEQAAVREVFPSITAGRVQAMVDALGRLSNDNAQGEYYFTDVFELCRQAGGRVEAVRCVGADDIVAPNDRAQLAQAGLVMQRRIQAGLFAEGVSIPQPDTVFVEHGATVGSDSTLLPFTFVGRGAKVGAGCTIGPFGHVAAGGVVPDGTSVAGNVAPATILSGGVE
jgi:bifunctional UDP-N-acetylglucosamine pyrophosphorylase/glucosamine-1-phosphate N-acetyltransferase